ncbi:MAG: hypothetical protein ACKKMP_03560 [Candidatus Nealsonbacteria bacterium]
MAEKEKLKLSIKLKAIENIVKELNKFSEEERIDIIDFALKQLGIRQLSLSPKGISPEKEEVPPVSKSIDKFVAEKNPKDQYQRVAVLAYYLKHSEKVNEFKNKEIDLANRRARQAKIGNPADVIGKAETRYGFLTKGVKTGRQLSTLGEKIVDALPDHEKVKAIIKSSKKPRKRAKKRKRTKSK